MAGEEDRQEIQWLRPLRFDLEETKGRFMESCARLRDRERRVGREAALATCCAEEYRERSAAIFPGHADRVHGDGSARFYESLSAIRRRRGAAVSQRLVSDDRKKGRSGTAWTRPGKRGDGSDEDRHERQRRPGLHVRVLFRHAHSTRGGRTLPRSLANRRQRNLEIGARLAAAV